MATQLYPQRWVQLGYLATLALLSDWVCFSVAAAPETYVQTYAHDPATLIDIFLFTNVFFCFLEPMIVRRVGLRNCIVGAAVVMTAGCALRSGLPLSGSVPSYTPVVAGTILVGAAQPFFQCTPPLLSAMWFGAEERATATATAINFNQVGIATAFLVGGAMASTTDGLASYFDLITFCSVLVTIGAFFQFQERPPLPPSSSAAAKILEDQEDKKNNKPVPSFFDTARQLLAVPGFTRALCAFVVSIGVSNVLSAFVEETLVAAGITGQQTIDFAGAGFQAAIVLGGVFLGGYVDRTKQYKLVTQGCLLAALLLLLPLGDTASSAPVVLGTLIALGAVIGPVQPINAELAVEVAYPADENSIEALQQLCGNLFSALLVPIAEGASKGRTALPAGLGELRGDFLLLGGLTTVGLAFFSTFDATLRRSALDCAFDETDSCELVGELSDDEVTELDREIQMLSDGPVGKLTDASATDAADKPAN
jgi:hypothetical protein